MNLFTNFMDFFKNPPKIKEMKIGNIIEFNFDSVYVPGILEHKGRIYYEKNKKKIEALKNVGFNLVGLILVIHGPVKKGNYTVLNDKIVKATKDLKEGITVVSTNSPNYPELPTLSKEAIMFYARTRESEVIYMTDDSNETDTIKFNFTFNEVKELMEAFALDHKLESDDVEEFLSYAI